jgi:hypothetical protein
MEMPLWQVHAEKQHRNIICTIANIEQISKYFATKLPAHKRPEIFKQDSSAKLRLFKIDKIITRDNYMCFCQELPTFVFRSKSKRGAQA